MTVFLPLVLKAVDKAVSMKVLVVVLSTWLFYIDKLNQDGWVTVVLGVTGMRMANEVAAMYKEVRMGEAPAVSAKRSKKA